MSRASVLVVSAATGTGHARAGEALRTALSDGNADLDVRHVDLLTLAPGWVRAAYGGGYELMATRAPWLWDQVYRQTDGGGCDRAVWSAFAERLLFREFRRLLRSVPWRMCVCTHFLPCQLAAGKPGLPPFALAITDFTLHRYWVQPGVRHYFVATDTLADDLRERRSGARVDATGIPISPLFESAPSGREARALLGLDPHAPIVVVMGGGLGLGVAEMVQSTLAGAPPGVQIVAVCGRNVAALGRLQALDLPRSRLRVEGYVTGIERFLAAADLIVTKPGGLTCSEALALGRPLLLTRAIPGQELGNTRALLGAGAALSADGGREVAEAVGRLFAEPGLLMGLSVGARRLARPASARTIAADIIASATAENRALA